MMTANSKTKPPDRAGLHTRILDPNIRLHILSKKNFFWNFIFFSYGQFLSIKMDQNLDLLRSKIEKGRNVGNDLNNNFSSDEKNRNFDEKIFFLEKSIF